MNYIVINFICSERTKRKDLVYRLRRRMGASVQVARPARAGRSLPSQEQGSDHTERCLRGGSVLQKDDQRDLLHGSFDLFAGSLFSVQDCNEVFVNTCMYYIIKNTLFIFIVKKFFAFVKYLFRC